MEQRLLLDAGATDLPTPTLDAPLSFPDAFGADWVSSDESGSESTTQEILVKLREPSKIPLRSVLTDVVSIGPLTVETPPSLSSVLVTSHAVTAEKLFGSRPEVVAVQTGEAESVGSLATQQTAEETPSVDRWYRIQLPPDADPEVALSKLNSLGGVEVAEGNIEWNLNYDIPPVIEGLPDGTTDPGYDDQWFHNNAYIWKAWDHLNRNGVYPGGQRDVVVAVIDTGVDYTHEELAANMWVNPGEIPGNNIDDDGNGFVDDIHGASVVSNTGAHTGDPVDYHGHGTHVAGIIAGQGFNGVGGVGVAFNTQIMAVRAAQYSGTLTVQDIAEGILYAADNGAEVINMSFGGYQRSQIVEDALEIALNKAVLVAAAGNDGVAKWQAPSYPAALPWVLGVEASTPKNTRAGFSNYGYEVRAPGQSIYSTLPGDQYAAWSGTSMATPVISGVAALMRSYYWQRDIYSSRFIMGSIAASDDATGVVDAFKALTEPPKPGVTLYENWMFDDAAIDPGNDGDGRADAGETIHLAIEVINRSGSAENVSVTLSARARGAVMDDPYVTITTPAVNYGSIGPFALADNGLIWNHEGVITGVEHPFVVEIDPSCPNDHVIPFIMTTTFQDGWDENKPTFTRIDEFSYVVQRGKNVPRVISEDTVLSADDFWIVSGPVLVEPQATLTIAAGAQVQWGAISDDPYNPGPQPGSILVRGKMNIEGTQEQPVQLFPSYLVSGQQTNVTVESGGEANIQYATIRNPKMSGLNSVDHVYVDWDNFTSQFTAQYVANTIFHRFRGASNGLVSGVYDTVLFEESWVPASSSNILNSVFLQDNQNNHPLTQSVPGSYHEALTELPSNQRFYTFLDPRYHEGDTYVLLPMEWDSIALAERIANYYGGHVLSLHSEEELEWIKTYMKYPKPQYGYDGSLSYVLLGGTTYNAALDGDPGEWNQWRWVDGSPMDYTNWAEGQPELLPNSRDQEIVLNPTTGAWSTRLQQNGGRWGGHGHPTGWPGYLLKIPGDWTYAELMAPYESGELLDHIAEVHESTVRFNAFLSKMWDPNINHWMRINAPGNAKEWTTDLSDNFWGTDTVSLINYMIYDYVDNFTSGHVDFGTPPAHGFESTFPFVEQVLINGVPAAAVPEVGAGPTTYTVTFNRDMAPLVQPFVAFGPAAPFTDFTVHPTGQSTAVFTVRLSQPASRSVSVQYATQDGSAVAGADYVAKSGTLIFEPGEVLQTIEVKLLGDHLEEADRTFSVRLSEPAVATIADGLGQGLIEDDDPTLSISDAQVTEGDAAAVEAVFTVTLSKPLGEAVTVEYRTESGTADSGVDFQPTVGTLTLDAGETAATIAVPVLGDGLHESVETFAVRIGHSNRVNVAQSVGTGTIADDDPLIRVENAQILEGDAGQAQLVFTVRLSQVPVKTITVDYATGDATALAGSDYTAASGVVTFAAGGSTEQEIHVPVLGDEDPEPNEVFNLQLSNAVGGVIETHVVQGTILGDDGPVFSVNDVSFVEADGWTSYFGAEGHDEAYDLTRDAEGNYWMVGRTTSAGLGKNSYDTTHNGGTYDGFVAKFAADGSPLWARYLGGNADDEANAVTIDAAGYAWVVGRTKSAGWTADGFDYEHNGNMDAFVARLTPDGEILWSSYLGGTDVDYATAIAIDDQGNGWVVGDTRSAGWTVGGPDTTFGGNYDMMLAKVTPQGALLWTSYYGTGGYDYARTAKVDNSGHILIYGDVTAADFAVGGADVTYNGGWDTILTKFDRDGEVIWSTYVGAAGHDYSYDFALDSADNAWLVGNTTSTGWATGFDTTFDGGHDGFVAKVTADGQQIPWVTYLGGNQDDYPRTVEIAADGTLWVAGGTRSADWTVDGPDLTFGGGTYDGFLAKIDPVANQLYPLKS